MPKQRQKYRDEPVFHTWVDYTVDRWSHQKTLTTRGVDDQPRIAPTAELDNRLYPQRLTAPSETCRIYGNYPWNKEIKTGQWNALCSNFSLVDVGDTHTMRVNRLGMGELTFDQPAK